MRAEGRAALRKLFSVEGASPIPGGQFLLYGKPTECLEKSGFQTVEIRAPDGRTQTAQAEFSIAFGPPERYPIWACFIMGVTGDDLPPGAELWAEV